MELKVEDLAFNLKATNEILRVYMASDASWDLRYRAYERLQSNMRALGCPEAEISAIPVPESTYRPPADPARQWYPDAKDRDPNAVDLIGIAW